MSYGFKTVLELDGKRMDVTVCSYHFKKDIDENGDVTSPIAGGLIYLSLTDIPENNLLKWGIEHREYKSGKIIVMQQDEEKSIQNEEVSFANAACVNMKLNFERDSTNYFTTLLTISAQDICVGRDNCWINKDWK